MFSCMCKQLLNKDCVLLLYLNNYEYRPEKKKNILLKTELLWVFVFGRSI